MDQATPLLIMAALLLVPLVPAAIIYLLLTPRQKGRPVVADTANGTMEPGLFGLKVQFNLVGSSATYFVLLAMAFMIYDKAEAERVQILQAHVSELSSRKAWMVEVPITIRNAGATSGDAIPGGLSQVQLRLDPGSTAVTSNMIRFWVTPTDKHFPTAWLSYPDIVKPAMIDLNDTQHVKLDYDTMTLSAVEPVSLEVGAHYAAN